MIRYNVYGQANPLKECKMRFHSINYKNKVSKWKEDKEPQFASSYDALGAIDRNGSLLGLALAYLPVKI